MASLIFLQANLDHTRAATGNLVDFKKANDVDVTVMCDPFARGSTIPEIPESWHMFCHPHTPRCVVVIPRPRFDVFPISISPYIVALQLQTDKLALLLIGVYAAPSVPLSYILTSVEGILDSHPMVNVASPETLTREIHYGVAPF